MYDVDVADRQSILALPPDWIAEIVQRTLAEERVVAAQIVVALLNDAMIHSVNRDFLQHDDATDVISFLYDSEQLEETTGSPGFRGAGLRLEGEIVISTETAARTALELESSPEREVALYLVHGLLHLCGYDDLTEDERQLMRVRERSILKLWDLTPHETF